MGMENELPKRKKNRLENFDYSSCGAYFLTICTSGRRNYFWNSVGATIGRPYDVAGGATVEGIYHKTYWSFHLAKAILRSCHKKPQGLRRTHEIHL